VQVGQVDGVDLVERHAGGQVVGGGARSEVEDEVVAVAELDVDRGAIWPGLISCEVP
jgi:hypothetical protein